MADRESLASRSDISGSAPLGSSDDSPLESTERVLDALPRAIVATDRSGVILAWNRNAELLYGRSRSEVVGQDVRTVVASAVGLPGQGTVLESVLAGERWEGDVSVLRRDGSPVRVFAVVNPLLDANGQVVGVVAASEDVTDRRLLEQEAADVTRRLQLALEAGSLGTWQWDAASGEVAWDAQLEQIFGFEPGGFDGSFETYRSRLHPDDRDDVLAEVDAAMAERRPYHIEHRVVWADGAVHWVQGRGNVTLGTSGEVTGTTGCVADITATKLAEHERERHAAELTTLATRQRRQREQVEFLTGLSAASATAQTHGDYMESAARAAVPRLGDWCSIYFVPETGAEVERKVAHTDPAKVAWAEALADRYPYDPEATTGVPQVIRSGTLEHIEQVDQDLIDTAAATTADPDEVRDILGSLSLTSLLTVPLVAAQGVIGALQFVSAESGRRFDQEDIDLAVLAAARIAEALENIWLTDQHRSISAALQRSLLPPAVAEIPSVQVAVRYWPAGAVSEVGGDFYDVFSLDDDHWAIVIGDTCGTGPNAAALTGIVRHTLRAAARHDHDHATVLTWVNQAVLQSGRDLFCTAAYATLERRADGFRLTSASAGHPLPVIARASGPTTPLGRAGTLLGVFDDISTTADSADLARGDTVVFYTDGVTDLPPPHGLSAEGLVDLVADAAQAADADAVADAIERSLSDRLPANRRRDDTALVILRIT